MRRADLLPSALTTFYSSAIESILISRLSVWYDSGPAADQKALQRVVRTAEKITRLAQPSIQDLYLSHCRKRATNITKDPTHPAHNLFTPYHLACATAACGARLQRLSNSLFPQAIRLLDSLKKMT